VVECRRSHLKQLLSDGTLTNWRVGSTLTRSRPFRKAPAEDDKLVESFLKDDRFLLASPNAYNGLGVGTTQLYDKTVVYITSGTAISRWVGVCLTFVRSRLFPRR